MRFYSSWEEIAMSSIWGNFIKLSIFGESHSAAIGVVIDALPAGKALDLEKIAAFMARRAPNKGKASTKRNEKDQFEIVSGYLKGTPPARRCALSSATPIPKARITTS